MNGLIPLAIALAAVAGQGDTLDDLVRRLDADAPETREQAFERLKALGAEALPRLERAAAGAPADAAGRLRRLAALIRLAERERLGPAFFRDMPRFDEELLDRGPAAWVRAFVSAVDADRPLADATWNALAERAAQAASTDEQRLAICGALQRRPVEASAPGLATWFTPFTVDEPRQEEPLLQAVELLIRMDARPELLRIVTDYGRLPKAGGKTFEWTNPNIAYRAFEALRDARAVPELLAIARRPDCGSVHDAVHALGDLRVREAVPDLIAGLASENPWVRHHAARGLGKMGVREAVPGLLKLLDDPLGPPRRGALDALSRLGVRDGLDAMIRLVHDKHSSVQVAAMRALADLGAKEAAPAVQAAGTHRDPGVRAVAVETAVRILGKEAFPDAELALRDKDAVVRLHAAAALCSAGSLRGVPVLIRLAQKPDESVHLNLGDGMSGGGELGPPALFSINPLRAPKAWERLGRLRFEKEGTGRIGKDLPRIAAEAGLALRIAPGLGPLDDSPYGYGGIPADTSFRQALALMTFSVQILLDEDALAVHPKAAAAHAWMDWWVPRADPDDRAEADAMKAELARAALPREVRAELEAKERAEAKRVHRAARTKALEGALTPGLRARADLVERLLDGHDAVWTALGLELAAARLQDARLSPEDLGVLFTHALRHAAVADDKQKLLGAIAVHAIPGTGEEVLRHMGDEDGRVRAAALAALPADAPMATILAYVPDPAPRVRGAVVGRLRDARQPEAVEALKTLSRDREWEVADPATMHLSFRDDPSLVPHMIGRLETAARNSNSAAFALGYLGRQGAREAVPDILRMLQMPRQACTAEALRAFRDLGAREAAPYVLELLRTGRVQPPDAAALLEALDHREAIPPLRRVLTGKNPHHRNHVIVTLARMGDREGLPVAVDMLRGDAEARRAACDVLSRLEGPAARESVLKAFGDPEVTPDWALVRVGAREAVAELLRRTRSVSSERFAALLALGGREALPRLLELLSDPKEDWDYGTALQVVARTFPRESKPAVLRFLEKGIGRNRLVAALLLCEQGDRGRASLLLDEGWPSASLNALRRPDVWRTLHETRFEGRLYGTGRDLLAGVARIAGMKVEGPRSDAPGRKAWEGYHHFPMRENPEPPRLIEVLERLEDLRWGFVLEPGTIRVLPREEALAFWRSELR